MAQVTLTQGNLDSWLGLQLYTIRLHTNHSIDSVQNFVRNNYVDRYLISKEIASREHYHVLLCTQVKLPTLRARIKAYFSIEGNREYSLVKVKDERQLKKYILKDDMEIRYAGITDEEIESLKKLSHKKGNPKLMDELETLAMEYYDNKFMTEVELLEKWILIQNSYGRNTTRNSAINFVNYHRIRKDKSAANQLAKEWLGIY